MQIHQSIPAATIPSQGQCGAFACLIVPMGGHLQLHVHLGAGPLSIRFITPGHSSLTEKRRQPHVLVVFSIVFLLKARIVPAYTLGNRKAFNTYDAYSFSPLVLFSGFNFSAHINTLARVSIF